jgi:FkbM family methyltransferase
LPVRILHGYRILRHLWLFPFEREVRLIPRFLKSTEVAIDVGANVGLMSTVLARGSLRVIALEPNPYCAEQLRKIGIKNCAVIEAAASDHAGQGILRVPAGHSALGSVDRAPGSQGDEADAAYTIALEPLDDVAARLLTAGEKICFVKIDVEGHEYAVLQGARSVLEKHRPTLMIEVEYRHGARVAETFGALAKYGYRPYVTLDGAKLVPTSPEDLRARQADENAAHPINNVFFLQATAE